MNIQFTFLWIFLTSVCFVLLRVTKEGSGGRRQAGTAYLNLIWLWPARLTLRMDLLSQFDIYYPAPNSSYPNSMWGVLQQLNYLAKGNIYTQFVYNSVQMKEGKKGKFWQLFHDDGKEQRHGEIRHSFSCCLIAAKPAKSLFSINFSSFCPL